MEIKKGFIYWINLDPTRGSEIKKSRPCVVMGVDPINKARRTVVVIPLSSSGKEHPPLTIQVTCMKKPAVAVIDQIRAVDKSRVIRFCDELDPQEMTSLEVALRAVLGL